MPVDVLWLRLGDGGNYEAFDDVDCVAALLSEVGIEEVERYCLYGVIAAGFEGHNYISLYWGADPGDGTAEASRELTDDELMDLQMKLDDRHGAFGRRWGR